VPTNQEWGVWGDILIIHKCPYTHTLLNIWKNWTCLHTGYDGEYCQDDANGCDVISCLEGQQCFDYPAPLVGAECSCPSGYVAGNDSKCVGEYSEVLSSNCSQFIHYRH